MQETDYASVLEGIKLLERSHQCLEGGQQVWICWKSHICLQIVKRSGVEFSILQLQRKNKSHFLSVESCISSSVNCSLARGEKKMLFKNLPKEAVPRIWHWHLKMLEKLIKSTITLWILCGSVPSCVCVCVCVSVCVCAHVHALSCLSCV